MSGSEATAPLVEWSLHEGVGRITISRPKALNALNSSVLAELEAVVDRIALDRSVRVVVVAGAGDRSFVAGADITQMVSLGADQAREFATAGQRVFAKLENLPQAVLAQVQGFALGGGLELAMSCDLILASTKALLGQPEINLGIIPGFGGTQRLARRVGASKARELIWTGQPIGADVALRIGLVDVVHEPERLANAVDELATSLAAKAPEALRQAKRAISAGLEVSLERGMTIEATSFGACFATADAREGLTAFLEKRAPKFVGP